MATLTIDTSRRSATMRAHTATHLLHACLVEIFPHTHQAWSYVGPDELRFDFLADRSLNEEELSHINQIVNRYIAHWLTVTTRELPYEEALKLGAKAFFEEKYPDTVRVVSIASLQDSSQSYSIELCGGTHVAFTSEIGAFIITEQTTIAAGTKRIVALTWPKVAEYALALQYSDDQRAKKLWVSSKQLDDKLDKILMDSQKMKNNYSRLIGKYIKETQKKWHLGERKINLDYIIYLGDGTEKDITMPDWTFQDFFEACKGLSIPWISRIVYTNTWQYAFFDSEWRAKKILSELDIKWWWSPVLMQWKDEKIGEMVKSSRK